MRAIVGTSRRRQRGVALLTAILVVAVATVIATNLLWLSTLDLRRTGSTLAIDQELQFVLGAEAWVGDILQQDLEESSEADHLGEIWATQIEPLPIDGGFIHGTVVDLQGLFNLNNLIGPDGSVDPIMRAQFDRLLVLLELDPLLSGAVIDWIDPNFETTFPSGGEDEVYSGMDPQYRAANGMITTPSELMAMNGFDAEIYARLAPYVTALPTGTTLNVNTAPQLILQSLSEDIDRGTAELLITERGDAEFPSVRDTFQDLVSEDMLPRIDGVSDHFLLVGQIAIGETTLRMNSVLQRHESGKTRALFRSFGVQ